MAYIRWLRECAAGRQSDDPEALDLATERAKLAVHQQEKTRLESELKKLQLAGITGAGMLPRKHAFEFLTHARVAVHSVFQALVAGAPVQFFGGYLENVHADPKYRLHVLLDEFRQMALADLEAAWSRLAQQYLGQGHTHYDENPDASPAESDDEDGREPG